MKMCTIVLKKQKTNCKSAHAHNHVSSKTQWVAWIVITPDMFRKKRMLTATTQHSPLNKSLLT